MLDVFGAGGHPVGDRVGREDEAGVGGFEPGGLDPIDKRIDKAGMVEVDAEFVDLHRFGAGGGLGGVDIFAVLTAAGITTEGGGNEGEDTGDAVQLHLREGVVEEGMPIAITEVDGKIGALPGEQFGERVDDGEVLLVDRTLAAEVEIMLRDYFEAFAGNASTASYVFEEGHYVGGLIGATEADKENCVGHR